MVVVGWIRRLDVSLDYEDASQINAVECDFNSKNIRLLE